MTFQLPDLTALLLLAVVPVLLMTVALASAAVVVVKRHRPVRLARHESIGAYWAHTALGH